jgi:hypothetical protein
MPAHSSPTSKATVDVYAPGIKRPAHQSMATYTTLNDVTKRFESASAELGKPWGTDEIGATFEKDYLPSMGAILATLHGIANGLLSYKENLDATHTTYDTEYSVRPTSPT